MVSMIEAARNAARQAQESLYEGVATIIEYKKVKDEKTKTTKYENITIVEDQPCRVSFSNITTVSQGDSAASKKQTIKLFISPDITIKPGSKIIVTQNGITTDYTYSGVPARYSTHQEIMLELFERWS